MFAKSNDPLGRASPYSPVHVSSTSTAVLGGMYFRRVEDSFADII